ncbi:multidrug ABC transporter ATP-binding protein [Sphaerisporangium melleum]|uniref:Multidrug ABC transporter ATP-binding protein n=1 Tax=Sphaerisporangium melleum TaxID=321316 RepID=A0A917R4C8_9ACTN|nr:ABC transporter ATP-binding protein [Sphaerisporangium melleum]GGK90053.1 multidrug ABC transporter ATP-binding protein [Sphaerisporangium melleum]GII72573.1 multidrug ABC transporter ATP-binding protein [Sphaerisporangium melleum]
MAAIEIRNLSKSFGAVRAVEDVSFAVEAGGVTGFLGPNGAGKTTTLRCLLGLVRPDSGEALVGGRRYADLAAPLSEVGAVLEATSFHPGRTARDHLRVLCTAAGLPAARAGEALDQVGLADVAGKRVAGFSLGMRQRLALATALLGRPKILILDEPANGLDPAGIQWLRGFLRHLADDQGCAVLVSSHVLSEVEQTVDEVVIIARGRMIRQGAVSALTTGGDRGVRVAAAQAERLRPRLEAAGATVETAGPGVLLVRGAAPETVGQAALDEGVVLSELVRERSDLEQVFLELTGESAAPPAAAETIPGGTP